MSVVPSNPEDGFQVSLSHPSVWAWVSGVDFSPQGTRWAQDAIGGICGVKDVSSLSCTRNPHCGLLLSPVNYVSFLAFLGFLLLGKGYRTKQRGLGSGQSGLETTCGTDGRPPRAMISLLHGHPARNDFSHPALQLASVAVSPQWM